MIPISDWRPVPSTGNKIEVNEWGYVRYSGTNLPIYPRIKQDSPGNRYLRLKYWQPVNGKIPGKYCQPHVHKLVAEVFLGPRPEGYQVNHKNGDTRDNRVVNLEYVTPKENVAHAWKTGLAKTVYGDEGFHHAKLTENDVRDIRELISSHRFNDEEIAKMYEVSRSTIKGIRLGYTWQSVPQIGGDLP